MKNKNVIVVGVAILIAVLLIIRTGQAKPNIKQADQLSLKTRKVELIDAAAFSKLIKDQDTFLIDVHTPEQTHIPGTDAFIPFDEISENISQLPEDKNTPILVYCRSGGMSKSASKKISDLGYTNVVDLDGGIKAYKDAIVQVALTPTNQDLGTVIYGDIATTSFTLTNFSPLPLMVTRVSTSCGCTSAEIEKEELGAYESTRVNVSFNPAVHKDDTDLGDLTRKIYIETNNVNFPNLEVVITANVIKK